MCNFHVSGDIRPGFSTMKKSSSANGSHSVLKLRSHTCLAVATDCSPAHRASPARAHGLSPHRGATPASLQPHSLHGVHMSPPFSNCLGSSSCWKLPFQNLLPTQLQIRTFPESAPRRQPHQPSVILSPRSFSAIHPLQTLTTGPLPPPPVSSSAVHTGHRSPQCPEGSFITS